MTEPDDDDDYDPSDQFAGMGGGQALPYRRVKRRKRRGGDADTTVAPQGGVTPTYYLYGF